MPMKRDRVSTNPTPQEIKDQDVEVHNYLLKLAQDGAGSEFILAAGLSAIHERLGNMWIFDKQWRA